MDSLHKRQHIFVIVVYVSLTSDIIDNIDVRL